MSREDRAFCVVCCKRYPENARVALYVFPDGCTAHAACAFSEEGRAEAKRHEIPEEQNRHTKEPA